ncbi:hypothetical protein [Cyanobium sp. Copco_Reservoir_LC18]|uniref:hypothetical protein n=1 Tax=Cyanobium sp. Copco_Reservoir_LC18 TaxID=1328305 RepID=UPI00135A020C|nr:hypothetical protein [Cyanobium sp. Copco_Reservoir_LC18]
MLGPAAIAAAEQAGQYHSLGPVYTGIGMVGDFSLEIGFQSGEGQEQQRSGIGFFIRSDHIAKRYVKLII